MNWHEICNYPLSLGFSLCFKLHQSFYHKVCQCFDNDIHDQEKFCHHYINYEILLTIRLGSTREPNASLTMSLQLTAIEIIFH